MKRLLFALMVASLLFTACGVQKSALPVVRNVDVSSGGAAPMMEAPMPADDMSYETQKVYDSAVTANVADPERLVIQNADLTIVLKDPAAKMQAISEMAERLGGFVVSSNMGERYLGNGVKVPEGSIMVRVPAENLDEALKEIKADVVEVQSENRTGQDVTQQYTDLKSQLKNLEATEQQLTLIMQKAEKTEDVLAVFNQLTQIRGQIEVTKGQIQYYEQSAALSAISVRLIAEESIQPIEIGGWKPVGVVRDAIQSLVNFLKGFFEFVVNLIIVIIPAIVLIFAVIYGMWRLFKFMFRLAGWKNPFKRKTPPAPPAAPVG